MNRKELFNYLQGQGCTHSHRRAIDGYDVFKNTEYKKKIGIEPGDNFDSIYVVGVCMALSVSAPPEFLGIGSKVEQIMNGTR